MPKSRHEHPTPGHQSDRQEDPHEHRRRLQNPQDPRNAVTRWAASLDGTNPSRCPTSADRTAVSLPRSRPSRSQLPRRTRRLRASHRPEHERGQRAPRSRLQGQPSAGRQEARTGRLRAIHGTPPPGRSVPHSAAPSASQPRTGCSVSRCRGSSRRIRRPPVHAPDLAHTGGGRENPDPRRADPAPHSQVTLPTKLK